MTYNSLINFDLTSSVVQTTDGTTTVTILTTPAFGLNASGSQIVTFDITGYEATYMEVVTAKVCVKIINNSGVPAMVGVPVHLIPIAVGSSTNLQTASVDVIISGTNLLVNVIGVAGKTINWVCNRFPSLQLISGLSAATLNDGYVSTYDGTNKRWKPESIYNVVGALGRDLSGLMPNPNVVGLYGKDLYSGFSTVGSTQDGYVPTWVNANNRWEPRPVNELGPPSAGGDLSGTYPNPTVVKIQGRAVASTSPSSNAVYQWNSGSSQWQPVVLGSDVTGSIDSNTVVRIQNRAVVSTAPSDGNVYQWSSGSSQWQPVALSGDLTGNINSNTLSKILGRTINTTAPSNNQVYAWSASDAYWRPVDGITTLTGDVNGTTTNNRVDYITGTSQIVYLGDLNTHSTMNLTGRVPTTDTTAKTISLYGGAAYASATGLNRNGGDLYLSGGTPTSGGSSGNVYISTIGTSSGTVFINWSSLSDSGNVVIGHSGGYIATTTNQVYIDCSNGGSGRLRIDTTTGSTVGSAGGASALPATPTGYITININGTDRKIPYYNT